MLVSNALKAIQIPLVLGFEVRIAIASLVVYFCLKRNFSWKGLTRNLSHKAVLPCHHHRLTCHDIDVLMLVF